MELLLLASICLVAILYSSVGHGGASGYLAVLSLSIYATQDPIWLKQHVWSLNLIVASIAFFTYKSSGYFSWKLTIPFIVASIPAAMIGGYLKIDNGIYDTLLSITLIFASWRLLTTKNSDVDGVFVKAPTVQISIAVGTIIGLLSGIIGVGGGIFLSPIILLFGWSDAKTAAGVAAVFIWVNSASGLIGSSLSGELLLEFDFLLPLCAAVVIGGMIGSKIGADFSSQKTVRIILSSVLVIAAIKRILELIGL